MISPNQKSKCNDSTKKNAEEESRGFTLARKVSTSALSTLLSTEASLYFWVRSVRRFNRDEFSTLNCKTYTGSKIRYGIYITEEKEREQKRIK